VQYKYAHQAAVKAAHNVISRISASAELAHNNNVVASQVQWDYVE
jgi:hypothetical protein